MQNQNRYGINHNQLLISVRDFKKLTDQELLLKSNLVVTDLTTNANVTNQVVIDRSVVDLKKLIPFSLFLFI